MVLERRHEQTLFTYILMSRIHICYLVNYGICPVNVHRHLFNKNKMPGKNKYLIHIVFIYRPHNITNQQNQGWSKGLFSL